MGEPARILVVAPRVAAFPGAENMAIDEAMLELASSRPDLGYLRLYRWERPTLSLGFAQSFRHAVDEDYCRREGVRVVRRITGGRAVLHDRELTYAVALPLSWASEPSLRGCYGIVSAALAYALRSLGVPAVRSDPCTFTPSRTSRESCFASTAPDEILIEGRKVVGSAQRRGSSAFLQHGSILLHADVERHLRAAGESPDCAAGWIGIVDAMGREPDREEMRVLLADELARVTSSRRSEEGWASVLPRSATLLPRHLSAAWISRVA